MTHAPTAAHDRVIDAQELSARYLPNRSPRTISKDIGRRPHTLPPRLALPGGQQALWLESEVLAWLRRHQVPPSASDAPRRRGRPTKRERFESGAVNE